MDDAPASTARDVRPASNTPEVGPGRPDLPTATVQAADAGDVAPTSDGAGIDPTLLARARGLVDVPLAARAAAFDELNRDVVAALRAIEDV